MSADFPITTAQIVALFMECIFYGIYLVSLGHCLRILLLVEDRAGLRFKKDINRRMLVVALLLFICATLDVALGLRHNLDAFVYYQGPAEEELQNVSYWISVMKVWDYTAQTFIGDGMLIYRCWIVFGRSYVIVIPSVVLWLASMGCGVFLTYTLATLNKSTLVSDAEAVPYVESFVALTLVMNILTTSLIVWKIWSVDRRVQAAGVLNYSSMSRTNRISSLQRVMRIIIDSAAMYTISTIVFAITYIAGNNAYYGVNDVVIQIIGICFNLIIIRVDSGKSFGSEKTSLGSLPRWDASPVVFRHASTYPVLSILQTTEENSDKSLSRPEPLKTRDHLEDKVQLGVGDQA